MFAEVKCWCEHDCCEVDNEFDDMLIYRCDDCDCHKYLTPDWFDPWEPM